MSGVSRRERWRWTLANHLDRSRRFCWADLVSWAIDGDKPDETPLRELTTTGARCARGAETHPSGGCWCGKFRADPAPTTTDGDSDG